MELKTLENSNLPQSIKNAEVVDIRSQLPVNARYTWRSLKGTRDMNKITRIICHHTGMSKSSVSSYDDLTLWQNIARSHIRSNKNISTGDPGAPYHLGIRNGKIYVFNDFDVLVWGAASNNTDSIHIVVSGDYANHDTLTEEDRNALYAAILMAEANMPMFQRIQAHREVNPTQCPGYDINKVRSDLDAIKLSSVINGTEGDTLSKVYTVKTRIDSLYRTATTPGKYQELAQKYLLKVFDHMKKEGIL